MRPIHRLGLSAAALLLAGSGAAAGNTRPPESPAPRAISAPPVTSRGMKAPRPRIEVRAPAALAPPTVTLAGLNPGASIERSACVTVAMGRGAAYECGDLRLVHPLPGTRTMNRVSAPVLIYNSAHAVGPLLVRANVTLPAGPLPDSVVAVVRMNGAERGRGSWPQAQWAAGAARRIVVQVGMTDLATGVHPYALEVTSWLNGAGSAATVTDSAAVVNRRGSPFRPGWWLAGLEELHTAQMLRFSPRSARRAPPARPSWRTTTRRARNMGAWSTRTAGGSTRRSAW